MAHGRHHAVIGLATHLEWTAAAVEDYVGERFSECYPKKWTCLVGTCRFPRLNGACRHSAGRAVTYYADYRLGTMVRMRMVVLPERLRSSHQYGNAPYNCENGSQKNQPQIDCSDNMLRHVPHPFLDSLDHHAASSLRLNRLHEQASNE
jgi:hypothetical protein